MIHIEIPYSTENKRIDKDYAKKELEILKISDDQKYNVFEAIYNLHPREVDFDDNDAEKVLWLQETLIRMGVGFRRVEDVVY